MHGVNSLKIGKPGAKSMAGKTIESKKRCIWMDAGVIQFKLCDKDFDCLSCAFDQAMSASANQYLAQQQLGRTPATKKAKTGPWQTKMHQRFGERRNCPLMKSNLCHQCSFDELLEEQFDFFLAPEKPRVHEVFGIQVPTSNFMHHGHIWVALESADRVRLGLDDFSQKVLGPATKINLPSIGQRIRANEPFLTLGRQRKKAEVLAPLDGIIVAVNRKVGETPAVAHDDPYGEGWLCIVTPDKLREDLEEMVFGQCNIAWTESEIIKLMGMLQGAPSANLPTGGALIDDVYGRYPQLGWERLVHEFLHTV
jgi:glycine cleavage system H lipoate-binding protein